MCVERKSVSDLFSSFASGRLYQQVCSSQTSLVRHCAMANPSNAVATQLLAFSPPHAHSLRFFSTTPSASIWFGIFRRVQP
jgi:hypothetical protein